MINRQTMFHFTLILFSIIIISLVPIFLLANNDQTYTFSKKNLTGLGTFLGGILLIATFMLQLISFKQQRIEASIFELIKNSRENLINLRMDNVFHKDEGRVIVGRDVCKQIFEQYIFLQEIIDKYLDPKRVNILYSDVNWINNFVENDKYKYKNSISKILDKKYWLIVNDITYGIIFWGVTKRHTSDLEEYLCIYKNIIDIKKMVEWIKHIPPRYESATNYKKMKEEKYSDNPFNLSKLEQINSEKVFFESNKARIGNYFRHLFRTIDYIDRQSCILVNKKQKNIYMRILLSQLSEYEQALLFLDSLSRLGHSWTNDKKSGKGFITKYKMITDLSQNFINKMNPKLFYPKVRFKFEDFSYECKKT